MILNNEYVAGSDTVRGYVPLLRLYSRLGHQTVSVILSWILAMVLYPSVQARAQAELDALVGRSRLPDFDDRPSLPYIEATLTETLRWNPVTPLGACRVSYSFLLTEIEASQHYHTCIITHSISYVTLVQIFLGPSRKIFTRATSSPQVRG